MQRTVRTFDSLRTVILMQLNKFIDKIYLNSEGSKMGLAIRNTGGRPCLNGMFTEDCLEGMFEVADMKNWI